MNFSKKHFVIFFIVVIVIVVVALLINEFTKKKENYKAERLVTDTPTFIWNSIVDGVPSGSNTPSGVTYSQVYKVSGAVTGNIDVGPQGKNYGVRLTKAETANLGRISWDMSGYDFTQNFRVRLNCFVTANGFNGYRIGVGGALDASAGSASTKDGALSFNIKNVQDTKPSNASSVVRSAVLTWYGNPGSTSDRMSYSAGILPGPEYSGKWQSIIMEVKVVKNYAGAEQRVCTVTLGDNGCVVNTMKVEGFVGGGKQIYVNANTGAWGAPQENLGVYGEVLVNYFSIERPTADGFIWTSITDGKPAESSTFKSLNQSGGFLSMKSGTLKEQGVQLTASSTNKQGSMTFNVTSFNFSKNFRMRVCFYVGSGGSFFSFGVAGDATYSNDDTVNDGMLAAKFYNGQCIITARAKSTAQPTTFQEVQQPALSGVTYGGEYVSAYMDVITDGSGKRRCTVYWGNNMVVACSMIVNSTTWTPNGTYIYVSNKNEGTAVEANVNYVSLEYL